MEEKIGRISGTWDSLKSWPSKLKARTIDIAKKIKNLGKDDPRRIFHSFKVGLALTLVSMFYYFRPLYEGFGAAAMWAVLTVVVIFEFTVGATLCKGLNRGFATLLAGALGVGAEYFATLFGEKGEPIVLGLLVFLLAAASTFMRFFPNIKRRYDYGVLIFILTFSLVSVSGYRVEKILELAHQRVTTIIIGGATCMIISIFVCPVWAGEDLHNLVAGNIEKLGSFLEAFGDEFYKVGEEESGEKCSSSLLGYKSVLNSKATEESLANFAWWEPGHSGFRFRHPWKQYLKIGVRTRQCAYQIEALSGYLNSKPQEPSEFKSKIQELCKRISAESGKALKELSSSVKKMTAPSPENTHISSAKKAIEELRSFMGSVSSSPERYAALLEILPAITVASILIDITKCVEEIHKSVLELSGEARFRNPKPSVVPEKLQLLHRGSVKPFVGGGEVEHVAVTVEVEGEGEDLSKNINSCEIKIGK